MLRQLLPQAVDNFEAALRQLQTVQQETTQQNTSSIPPELNTILQQLSQPPRDARDMPRRAQLCQRALTLLPRAQNPPLWGDLQNELANSLVQNPLGERAANIEQALHHYQQVLEVYTRADFPVGWAMAQNNLATAYCERIRGERAANLEQAIQHYRQALEVRTAEALPADHLQTQRNLGYLHFGEGRWDQAHHAYDGAIVVGRSLLQAAYSEVGRQAEVAETALLYAHSAYCLVQMGDCGAALAQLEAGKTRLLAEALALSEADTTTLTKEHRQTLSDIRQHIRDLETECRLPANTPARRSERQITAELHETRAELNQLIDAIRVLHPDFMPEGLDLPGILALIAPDEVLVAPLFTPQGSAVFAVPPGMDKVTEEDAIPLDDFTDADLNRLLVGTEGDPGWLRAYFSRKDDLRNWLERLDMLTGRLWDRILAPIHNRLQVLGAKRVIFIPQGGLGVLPLHAAWRMENEQKRYFIA
jgi:tetratricopeptide (TPR) repeat protein